MMDLLDQKFHLSVLKVTSNVKILSKKKKNLKKTKEQSRADWSWIWLETKSGRILYSNLIVKYDRT